MSHELKTKGNKVLSFSTLREGHDQEQKKLKEGREWREERNGEKRETIEKMGKHFNCLAKSNDLKHAYLFYLPMVLLVYKDAFFNLDDLDSCVPSVLKVLLQEFEDVFLDDICHNPFFE